MTNHASQANSNIHHHHPHNHHHNHRNHHLEESTNDNSQSSNSSLSLNTLPNMVPMGDLNALTDSESNQAMGATSGGLMRGNSGIQSDSNLKLSNTNSQMDTDDSMTK